MIFLQNSQYFIDNFTTCDAAHLWRHQPIKEH